MLALSLSGRSILDVFLFEIARCKVETRSANVVTLNVRLFFSNVFLRVLSFFRLLIFVNSSSCLEEILISSERVPGKFFSMKILLLLIGCDFANIYSVDKLNFNFGKRHVDKASAVKKHTMIALAYRVVYFAI